MKYSVLKETVLLSMNLKLLGKWDSCRDDSMKRLKENLDRMFVAVVDDQAVGHSYWSLLEDKPCIYSIFVMNEARRMGIASALMDKCESQILASGYNQAGLSTMVTNPAQYAFLRMGYEKTETTDGWSYFTKLLGK